MATPNHSAPSRSGAMSPGKERVLVVDANADTREYVRRLLTPKYEVKTANNGEEALRLVQSEAPALVLADTRMPVLDGYALLRKLRAHPAMNTLPVILLSARAGDEAGSEGMEAGADDYLVKPFSARELLATVAAHLRLSSQRRQIATELSEQEAWSIAQREALEAALLGGQLETSLSALVPTATRRFGNDVRAAFYLAGEDKKTVRLIVGMSPAYARAVDGLKIGPESLACGLATHAGKPVVTPDVMQEPLWEPWRWLAAEFDYRGCWSFPLHTAEGQFVGSFALYFQQPREATPRDLEFAELVTQTAAIIIVRSADAEKRKRAEEALLYEQQTAKQTLEQQVASRTLELELRVAERDALLKEVHHRVRNNLQVIIGMLEMQAHRTEEFAAFNALSAACNRVMSIAQIHELLYRSGQFTVVDLATYAGLLSDKLVGLYQRKDSIRSRVQGENVDVVLEQAVTCGLLLNELISNACKHGFPNGRKGDLTVQLARHNGDVTLSVEDTGVGLPANFNTAEGGRLGFTIVELLTEQLRGRLKVESKDGLRVEVQFPAHGVS